MALVIETLSDSKAARADLAKLRESVNNIQTSVEKTTQSFANIGKLAAAGLAAFGSFQAFTKLSDEVTNLNNRIKTATNTQKEYTVALAGVKAIAISSRSGLSEVSSLYGRIAINSKELGINQRDTLRVVDTVSKALKLNAGSAAESASAILQFGQAIGAGALQGDELRSLLENAPPLAKAIADEFGVGVGQLKKLGEEGKLLSSRVLKAILNRQDEINSKFSTMAVTYEGAFKNLGTSLTLLFDAAKTSIFDSTGTIATFVNSLAMSIANVANNFSYYLFKAKTSVLFFIFDTISLFQDFWEILKETGERIATVAKDLYVSWKPALAAALVGLSGWAVATRNTIVTLYESIAASLSGSKLFNSVLKSFYVLLDNLKTTFSSLFASFGFTIPAIDVKQFFKNLEPMAAFISSWVTKIERAFFWLYDQVIGHSWIPDLVTGTIDWLKKLLKAPLDIVKTFTTKSSTMFAGINFSAPFTSALGIIAKYKAALLGVVATLATFVGLSKGNILSSSSSSISIETSESSKTQNFFEKLLSSIKKLQTAIKSTFDTSTFGRTLKQVFGVKDSTPGVVFGTDTVDTGPNAKVGRGPLRSQETRPVGHDVINALPKNWQIPVLAGVAGVFGLAIVKAFDSGPVRSVLLSVLTTAFGITLAQTVDDSTIKKTTGKVAYFFTDTIGKGLDAILSGNAIKDPLGTLSLLAKTSLLFEKGREAALKVTEALVTAPTKAAIGLGSLADRQIARRGISAADKELAQLPAKLNDSFVKANDRLSKSLNFVANLRDSSGNKIGALKASQVVTSGDTKGLSAVASTAATAAMIANTRVVAAEKRLADLPKQVEAITQQRKALVEQEKIMSDNLKAAGTAFEQGFKNISAGVAGTLGGIAGYQLGSQIARGMEGSSEIATLVLPVRPRVLTKRIQ